jgi:hypothetical protein
VTTAKRPRFYRIIAVDQFGDRWTKRGFSGGFTVEQGTVVQADGPVSWARGKSLTAIVIICEKNGWTLTETTD